MLLLCGLWRWQGKSIFLPEVSSKNALKSKNEVVSAYYVITYLLIFSVAFVGNIKFISMLMCLPNINRYLSHNKRSINVRVSKKITILQVVRVKKYINECNFIRNAIYVICNLEFEEIFSADSSKYGYPNDGWY